MSFNRVPCYLSHKCSTLSSPRKILAYLNIFINFYPIVLINCYGFYICDATIKKYYNAKQHVQITQLLEETQTVNINPS